jgi:hypothetical protein
MRGEFHTCPESGVPPGRDFFSHAFQALRTWLLSFCPSGTRSFSRAIQAINRLATIIQSLPDKRNFVPCLRACANGGLGMLLRRFILGNSRLGSDNRCKVLPDYRANIL